METFMTIFLYAMIIFIYFVPTVVSLSIWHFGDDIPFSDVGKTFLLNLFFGWTVIGWFFAWIWAVLGSLEGSGE